MIRSLLNSLLYVPSGVFVQTPEQVGLTALEVTPETEDGERLNGWWIAAAGVVRGHVLLCHGNAGNVADRLLHAALLSAVGCDVLLFDYRGYGRSSGQPSEQGTYRDARAALACLLAQPRVDPKRVYYLGESLGGAIALDLALTSPPAGLVLLSTFTGIRQLSSVHYPFIPAAAVPDAYPTLRRIPALGAPVLILHGACDDIVPVSHARALFGAAPAPKQIQIFEGVGHNDLVVDRGQEFARTISSWIQSIQTAVAH